MLLSFVSTTFQGFFEARAEIHYIFSLLFGSNKTLKFAFKIFWPLVGIWKMDKLNWRKRENSIWNLLSSSSKCSNLVLGSKTWWPYKIHTQKGFLLTFAIRKQDRKYIYAGKQTKIMNDLMVNSLLISGI